METTQFARVMRELGIQQIFALSPQAKGRVERMLETFQDRLVTELRLAGASSIDEAGLVLQEFLPRFNARFALAAEQPEMAYRPVPAELSLTETICIKDTRKVARDNTVKYHGRALQLLPGAERPSYAGLRVEVLERADGELLLQYQGEAVDYQEGPPPSSALWGAASACYHGPERQEGADGVVNSHLNEAQRERLAALESSESSDQRGQRRRRIHQGQRWKDKASSPPVAPDAHGDPAGSLGGGTTGQGAGVFPPGHRPEAGHGPKHRRKVRPGGDSAYKETQCQGACQSRDPGRITNLRRLNRVTYSLFI